VDGHSVFTESNPKLAELRLNELEPSVLVLDVDLGTPDLDGRTLCAQFAKTSRYIRGELRIIMISGHYIDPGDEIAGFKAGADNYLIKPFEMSQLAARVEAVARRLQDVSNPEIMQIDEHLIINNMSRIATMDGKELPLSKLEFNVLYYLAQSPGVVKTKSDLLEKVWSTPHVEKSAVSKCISLLRRKISKDDPEAYVQTVYGVGYRFSVPTNDDA